ncbi:hypothetical protein DSM104635_03543 [Terricaulis silvestris]|uniref:Uncharacterized protein n=1 Tax=Terricaulis silvestris TaxID=2686094 RepID=A0A6I6MYF4_9CAUL|nr:hypothetical protein DSM104635_03543 [Terricaulis silvestris]
MIQSHSRRSEAETWNPGNRSAVGPGFQITAPRVWNDSKVV